MGLSENTPPPENFQELYDELYAELPDLPDSFEDSFKTKYDFRTEVREKISFPITFLDQDESGTFDPASTKRPRCTPINRKKRERRQLAGDGTPKKFKSSNWQGGGQMGHQLISEAERTALKDLGTSLDNQPGSSCYLNINDDSRSEWPRFHARPYNLRRHRRCDLSDVPTIASNDDFNLEDITLNSHACRGRRRGIRCPLLHEGSGYPCAECVIDNAKYDPIAESAVKSPCEECRSRRQHCSYKEGGSNHANPCQQCAKSSRKCVAGSAIGRMTTGLSLDQGPPDREQTAQAPKYPARPRTKSTNTHRRRTITTKLAHPIHFNYAFDDEEGTAPCHWCADAVYGILGLGKVDVEVIESADGQGFIEIAGGHAKMYGHSRMCEFCTTDRLKITACASHEIERIEGMDPENFDHAAVTDWMMPGMASLAPFAWCSICPQPAFYRCSTKPNSDLDGQEGDDLYLGDQKGCGLHLCNSCAFSLVNEHDGKLDKMIDNLEEEEDDEGLGIRADASFLHLEGELLRRMGGF